MKLPQTIMGLSQIARVARVALLALILGPIPLAQAQIINRTITVTYTPAGGAPQSWEWRNMGTYFRAVAQISTDPVALPYHASIDLRAGDTITVREETRSGDIARQFILGQGFYRYSYYRFDESYYQDTQKLGAGMTRLVPSLPRVSNDAGLPTAILIPPSTSIDGRERDTRMITAEQVRRDMMRAIAMCRPVGQIEAINLGVNFDTPLALRVVLSPRPDASNTPNDVTFLDGWIRTRTMTAVSRLYMDRQGIWEAAMAERPRSRP